MPDGQGTDPAGGAGPGDTPVAPRKPLAPPLAARPMKGKLARRRRRDVKMNPKARALDQQFRRWAG